MLNDRKIVGDEEVGEVKFLLQVLQQVEDLRLNETSSAETASSHTIRRGRGASERAMPMRCRCPPEKAWG